jgi:hypothetical protein
MPLEQSWQKRGEPAVKQLLEGFCLPDFHHGGFLLGGGEREVYFWSRGCKKNPHPKIFGVGICWIFEKKYLYFGYAQLHVIVTC